MKQPGFQFLCILSMSKLKYQLSTWNTHTIDKISDLTGCCMCPLQYHVICTSLIIGLYLNTKHLLFLPVFVYTLINQVNIHSPCRSQKLMTLTRWFKPRREYNSCGGYQLPLFWANISWKEDIAHVWCRFLEKAWPEGVLDIRLAIHCWENRYWREGYGDFVLGIQTKEGVQMFYWNFAPKFKKEAGLDSFSGMAFP